MNHFERPPQSFRDQALTDVQKVAALGGYEFVMLEMNDDELRFQILSEDQMGLGQDEHEAYLSTLFERSGVLAPENTRVIVHPNYAINIVVDLNHEI